jgi:hypothetical protein
MSQLKFTRTVTALATLLAGHVRCELMGYHFRSLLRRLLMQINDSQVHAYEANTPKRPPGYRAELAGPCHG